MGNFEREKLYEALAFFSSKVKYAGWIKLLKLVFYLDLMHLRRVGRTVTGLVYNAWPMGPVPPALYAELNDPGSELRKHFDVQKSKLVTNEFTPTIDTDEDSISSMGRGSYRTTGEIKPKRDFKNLYLTTRELEIAKLLAEIFYESKAEDMSDFSHGKQGPWAKALRLAKQSGKDRPEIDLLDGTVGFGDKKLELPLDTVRELIEERASIRRAMR